MIKLIIDSFIPIIITYLRKKNYIVISVNKQFTLKLEIRVPTWGGLVPKIN